MRQNGRPNSFQQQVQQQQQMRQRQMMGGWQQQQRRRQAELHQPRLQRDLTQAARCLSSDQPANRPNAYYSQPAEHGLSAWDDFDDDDDNDFVGYEGRSCLGCLGWVVTIMSMAFTVLLI